MRPLLRLLLRQHLRPLPPLPVLLLIQLMLEQDRSGSVAPLHNVKHLHRRPNDNAEIRPLPLPLPPPPRPLPAQAQHQLGPTPEESTSSSPLLSDLIKSRVIQAFDQQTGFAKLFRILSSAGSTRLDGQLSLVLKKKIWRTKFSGT